MAQGSGGIEGKRLLRGEKGGRDEERRRREMEGQTRRSSQGRHGLARLYLDSTRPTHYGTKTGHFETSKIHFPTSDGVSEVSERANE